MIKLLVTNSSDIYRMFNIYFSNISARSLHNPVSAKKKANIFNQRAAKLI